MSQVTYRLLSRALKVPVNTAKEYAVHSAVCWSTLIAFRMLYEFREQQNAKKPDTIRATYLISGLKREGKQAPPAPEQRKDGEDEVMQSSPFVASSMPQPEEATLGELIPCMTLAKEEHLDRVRATYEKVNSIHIYSLALSSPKDLQVLSDVTREIIETYNTEDPLEANETYGTILNKNVRRRKGRSQNQPASTSTNAPAAPKAAASKPAVAPTTKHASKESTSSTKEASKPTTGKEFFSRKAASKESTPASTQESSKPAAKKEFFSRSSDNKTTTSKAPATKRESSSLMKSFAKTPKVKRQNTDNSTGASASESAAPSIADEPMKDDSDDEEDDYVPPPQPTATADDIGRQSRKEREAKLRKMMDESEDEEMPTPDEGEAAPEPAEEKKESQAVVAAAPGRRRGRRRVMKKKTIKDAEGYLGKTSTFQRCGTANRGNSHQRRSGLGIILGG